MGGTDALTRWDLGVSAVDTLLQAERSDPGADVSAITRQIAERADGLMPTFAGLLEVATLLLELYADQLGQSPEDALQTLASVTLDGDD